MKSIKRFGWIVWFAAILILQANTAQAQKHEYDDIDEPESKVINPDHDRILKFRPLDIGQISFSYEKLRTSKVSNEIVVSYIYKSYFKNGFIPDGKRVNGLGIQMSQRHYTSKKKESPFGFYHGPKFGASLVVFEKNVFGIQYSDPSSDNFVGRLTQNALDLGYQIGGQFQLGKHLTLDVGGSLGAKLKHANANGAEEQNLLTQNIIGHAIRTDQNSALFVVPLPQLHFSVGYSF
jgi:hypothetical protein